MAYVDYAYYQFLYGDSAIPEADFKRLSGKACRLVDVLTTGIDGVRKLEVAFPTDEYDAENVKTCICELVVKLNAFEKAEQSAQEAAGYTKTENGLQGKIISSISSGNESISFANGSSGRTETAFDKAVSDRTEQEELLKSIIRYYLSGIADANGVNLLGRGKYPYYLRREN